MTREKTYLIKQPLMENKRKFRFVSLSAKSGANYIEYIQHGFYLDDLSHICGLKPFQQVT